jgi:hypothetical protein
VCVGVGAAEATARPAPAGASSPNRLSSAQASWAQRSLLPLGRDWIRSPGLTASPQTPQTVAYLAVIATRQAYGVAVQRGMAMLPRLVRWSRFLRWIAIRSELTAKIGCLSDLASCHGVRAVLATELRGLPAKRAGWSGGRVVSAAATAAATAPSERNVRSV